jgi:hypothetical protein
VKRLWRWIRARLGRGRRDGSASPGDCCAVSTLSRACGTAAGLGEGNDNGDGGPADSRPLHGYGNGRGGDDAGRLAERVGRLEERVLRLEEAWRGGGEGVVRTDGSEDGTAEGRDWTDAHGGNERENVWEGEGTMPQALRVGGVLAKAHELGADTPEGGDGADVMEALPTAVSRGVPQGLPGEQARRKAAQLWEGVL